MNKNRAFNPPLYHLAPALLLLTTACSNYRYQSFQDAGAGQHVAFRQRWESQIPYKSSHELVIERTSGSEVLLSDKQEQFHLTKISLGSEGQPEKPLHLQIERGDSFESLDNGQMLIIGAQAGKKYVTLVDPKTLSTQFSTELSFVEATDFTIPGWKLIGDTLVLYQSAVKIDRLPWSDGVYQYQIPYVAWSKYDIHLLNLTSRTVRSITAIDSGSLEVLSEKLPKGKEEVLSEARLGIGTVMKPKQGKIDNYIHLFDQVFLVSQGQVLIFSLANLKGDKLYYSLDLTGDSKSPKWRLAADLVAQYPTELVVADRSAKERGGKRELTISGKQYRIEHMAFLAAGLVVVGQENTSVLAGSDNLGPRKVIGVRLGGIGSESWERVWDYTLKYQGGIGGLIEDSKRGAVYFPESEDGEQFKVHGLSVADGQSVEAFPANFNIKVETNGKLTEVRIVGTAVDFERKLLYIHDREKNRLVCADLWRDAGRARQ